MTQAYMAVLAAFFGSLGFALLYNMRGKRILVPAVGGAFFWGFYLVFVQVTGNPYLGFFISAVLLTAYAEVWAIVLKTPVTVPLIPTVIPFIPGGGLLFGQRPAAGRSPCLRREGSADHGARSGPGGGHHAGHLPGQAPAVLLRKHPLKPIIRGARLPRIRHEAGLSLQVHLRSRLRSHSAGFGKVANRGNLASQEIFSRRT